MKGFLVCLFALLFVTASSEGQMVPKGWEVDHSSFGKIVAESANVSTDEMSSAFRKVANVRPNIEALRSAELSLDIEGVSYKAVRESVEERADGYVWNGFVSDFPFRSVTTVRGGIAVSYIWFRLGNRVKHYQVLSSKGQYRLEEVDLDKLSLMIGDDQNERVKNIISSMSENDGFSYKKPKGRQRSVAPSGVCPRGSTALYTIDIEMLYDQSTIDVVGSETELLAILQSFVDVENAVLKNSRIYNGAFKVFGFRKAPRNSTGDVYEDLFWLSSGGSGSSLDPGPDIINYTVGFTRVDAAGVSGGRANVSVVGGSWYVYIHEVGHSLEGSHQPEDTPSLATQPLPGRAARAHQVNLLFRTGISQPSFRDCPSFCDPIPAYSNPSVLYYGVPTGVKDERDNATMVRLSIPPISRYAFGTSKQCVLENLN